MTIDQELLLHKIEIAEGEVTLDAYILREIIVQLRREGKEVGYEDGYLAGRHDFAKEAREMIDEL